MKISDILKGISYDVLQGTDQKEVSSLCYDSRKVREGSFFICVTGMKTDGHLYIRDALEAGAAAILCEKELKYPAPEDIPVVLVFDSRKVMAIAAANYYHNPSKNMNLIGVTGTNGKTTITYLVKSVLDSMGHKTGVIGTIENRIGERVLPAEHTTPESLELQELFSEMNKEQVHDVVMEVSSHSLSLDRVLGCHFDVGVFTNLTQDHLDYHKTMRNYRKTKGILFQMAKKAVINIDDPSGEYMVKQAEGKQILTTGIDKKADLQAQNIQITAKGVTFTLDYEGREYPVMLHTPGKFSIYNALSAIGACLFLRIPMECILKGLRENPGVPGRFQTVQGKRDYVAIVDYAHTPDGLENVLTTVKEFAKGKIITVFGCGGDRDKTKRPLMGEIAGKYSDFCVITTDNPRTEDPDEIVRDIEIGLRKTKCDYIKIKDRRKAIFYAVTLTKRGDAVVVAGKGHEDYQIFADRTIHFSDIEEVRKALDILQ